MRICVCAYDFPPVGGGRSYRMATFASHWAALGHTVTVVHAGADPWNADNPDHEQAARLAEQVETMAIPSPFGSTLWRRIGPGRLGRALRRLRGAFAVPDLGRPWATRAVRALDARFGARWPFDWIVTSGPPHGVHAVGRAAAARGVRWAADFRDPLTDNRNYRPKSRWHARADARFEAMVMHRADLVVANTAGNRATLLDHHPQLGQRLLHVPNGFDPRDLPAGPRLRQAGPRFRVVYLGTIRDYSQALRLFEALLERHPEQAAHLELTHIGTRPFEGEIAERLRAAGRLRHVGFLPKRDALARLDDFEMGLVILPRERGAARTVPGKTYQYVGHDLPVLAVAPEGDLLEITRRARGLAVDCERIEVGAAALAEAIDAWARGAWTGRHAAPRGLAEEFRNDRLAAVWAGRMAEVSELPVWCPRPEPVATARAAAVLEGAG